VLSSAGEEEEAEPPRASQGRSRAGGGKVLSTCNTSMHARTYARISAGARTCRCDYRNQGRKHVPLPQVSRGRRIRDRYSSPPPPTSHPPSLIPPHTHTHTHRQVTMDQWTEKESPPVRGVQRDRYLRTPPPSLPPSLRDPPSLPPLHTLTLSHPPPPSLPPSYAGWLT
jgi:hypothetical protein